MKYKSSMFNYSFIIDSDTIGIYNTLSRAIFGMSLQEYKQLLSYPNGSIPLSNEQVYVDNGILVPYIKNEHSTVNNTRINSIINNRTAVYRILPTSDCNARCFYCYENRGNVVYMDKRISEQVSKFIIEQSGDCSIKIHWFGGEPLMNTDIIDTITYSLRKQYIGDKINFSMTSNGSLINYEIAQKMVTDWNISNIQITLDGTSHEYEKRKKYVGLKNAFEVVKNNILLLLKNGIKTSIRLNYDGNNYVDIMNLIEELGKVLPHVDNLHVYAYHLYGTSNNSPIDINIRDEWFNIQNALIAQGFSTHLRTFSLRYRTSQCFACQTNGFVISPKGELYKCTMSMDDDSAKIGDVWNGITNYSSLETWCDPGLETKCKDCVFLPICQGGCKAGILNYSSETCFVQKSFIDDVLRERIKYLSIYK